MDIVDDMRKDKIVQINNELTKTDTAQSRSGHDNPSNRGLKIIYQSIFNSLPNKSKLKDMSYFRKRNSRHDFNSDRPYNSAQSCVVRTE